MSSAAASSPSVYPPWTELPPDLTANILQRLGAEETLQSAQYVCATWWNVCHNPALWRLIKIVNREKSEDNGVWLGKLTMMCRRAVDLSQGQLLDLTLAYFGDDDLLRYIVDRSSRLQRLTVVHCSDISSTTLIESLKKLHELEGLHLIYQSNIVAVDIETIGNIFPMLKSFSINNHPIQPSLTRLRLIGGRVTYCNVKALAIAKSMPNLYHLGLFANDMNNEGLQAILDGCPRLESLDLRLCSKVSLGGPLGKRCCEQIKHLKLPSDSIDDYEWKAPDFNELGRGSNRAQNSDDDDDDDDDDDLPYWAQESDDDSDGYDEYKHYLARDSDYDDDY